MPSPENHPKPTGTQNWDDDLWQVYHVMCDVWKDALRGKPVNIPGEMAWQAEEHGLDPIEIEMLSYKSLCGLLGAQVGNDSRERRTGAF